MKNKKMVIVGSLILLVILISAAFAMNSNPSSTNPNTNANELSRMTLSVDIPCQGHASLIIGELKKVGASEVSFELPNLFVIKYDSSKIDKAKILELDVFKTYKATEVK